MLKKITVGCALAAMCLYTMPAQAQNFKQLANGLEYQILTDAPGKSYIKEGSYVSLHIRTKIADSSMFDSYKMNNDEPIEQQLTTQFLGSFMEGFTLLTAGDSAVMRLSVDSAFRGQIPPFAKSGDKVTYTVKILTVKTKEEYEASKKEAASNQLKTDDKIIQDYIAKNKIKNAQKSPSGLYYVIDKPGNGKHPTAADKVKVHYKGTLIDGTKFDSSYDRGEPIEFPLTQVIKGWTEGIPYLDEGGKGTLLIPSGLAYGQNPPPGSSIKANAVLIFEVELISFTKN
jgi:FKBP-type peptidyl-prolyl cis-trans isomerase